LCEDYREREAVKLARQSGAIRPTKKPGSFPNGNRITGIRNLYPLPVTLSPFGKFKQQTAVLNKTVFENLYSHSCVTVMFYLIAYDGAVDGGEPAVNWSIRQPHGETDRRGKLHASGQAEIKT